MFNLVCTTQIVDELDPSKTIIAVGETVAAETNEEGLYTVYTANNGPMIFYPTEIEDYFYRA